MTALYYIIYGFLSGLVIMATIKEGEEKREWKKAIGEYKKDWKKALEKYKKQREMREELPKRCPLCGEKIREIPAGISKRTNQPYSKFWACSNPECSFTCNLRGGSYACRWNKPKNQKGRTSEETTPKKSQESKKKEVQDTDEINVEDIPF